MGVINLNLNTMSKNIPAITTGMQGFFIEKTIACLHRSGHSSGVLLQVDNNGNSDQTCSINWDWQISELELSRAHVDLEEMVEYGACAIALLLIRELTGYTTYRQSAKGTHIDYYLVENDQDPTLIFNHAAKLEVSGILHQKGTNSVDNRISTKIKRLGEDSLPTIIIVVEFSQPWSKLVNHG